MKKENEKVRIKLMLVGGIIAVIGIILLSVFMQIRKREYIKQTNPELAKAMTYEEVKDGDEAVEGTDNVKFDAFFLRDINQDGYAESIRGTSKEIGKEDTLYMELNVQTEGVLKDAKITVNGENFYLQTALPKDNELKDNYIGNNIKSIEFNELVNGTQKMLTGAVRSGDYSYPSKKAGAIRNNINNYSKVNSVTLTGTYVGEDGIEIPITKTVEFNIDWYGTTKASINTTNQSGDLDNAISEEGIIVLDFTVNTQETEQELILSKNHVEGEIPELNGYAPTKVEYTGNNAVFNYDAETRTFTLERTAVLGKEGNVITSLSGSNSYGIKVTYPLEAYQTLGTETVQIKIPVKTYYEGYNNPSEEFTNPYKSNTAQATISVNYEKPQIPTGEIYETSFDVTVGKQVYSPSSRYIVSKEKPLKIYNGISEEEKGDTYTVTWRGYVGTNAKLDGMIMKETKDGEGQVSDQFIKTDSSTESVDEVVSNVGIYFSGADTLLGEEGWIKVYDEDTGNLLVTFTENDWNKYTSSNPYKYEIPVKHIRVETSTIQKNEASIYVYNIKEIDDEKITTKYTREEFDGLQYINSTLVGYIAGEYVETDVNQANYEAPISVANISISNNTISTQATEKNEKITIETQANETYNEVKWQNGEFLVKLPKEIIALQINNVTINNSSVRIENYELIENEEGLFIKIVTKNDTPQTYTITLDVNVTPDPRIATTTKQIELYASNENGSNYWYKAEDKYDVNNNLNTVEQVNYRTISINMVSPNSLLTNQIATNYDDKGSEVISPQIAEIKPQYAVVDQETPEEQTARIGVQVRNNYSSTISEVQILGKIPFEGNTYVISGEDLGSTFTTKMTNVGIEVPEELQEYAKVYYSEKETPDRDLSKAENEWKTAEQVENWDNIKTFLIDLGDYVMGAGAEYVFNYTVEIPNGIEFNKVSYSHHGIYFCLDTEQGKYRTQTEPNKLGFRIAEKYNLELTKYQKGKDKLVPGATYSITEIIKNEEGEEERGESKTGVTNTEGKLEIKNLYAEKEYEIKEIKTPNDYELNSDIIRFIGHVNEKGVLTIEKKQGTTRGDFNVIKEEGESYQVTVNVEDEVKASIKVIKKEEGTETLIQGAKFKLTGYGLSENGKTLTTNINGEITFRGLSVNQEYTLSEVKAEGYYLASPIKFKVVNNDGNYTVEKIEDETATGEIKEQTTIEEDGIPTISITIEDAKIPTYDLQIIKVKKTTESTVSNDELIAKAETALADTEVEYLAGAKFKLYKGTEEIGSYTTGSDGKVTITGLYQYESDKNIDQTYTLKEVLAPEGYAKVKDITFKVEVVDGALVLKEISEGEEVDSTRYSVEGNTISLTIEDSPSFKLIKKDAETGGLLAGVKFAIYNVDDGTEQPARNSKGEIIGTQETIDGKEYYTVTTDENGEITADLTEGLYKAVEVEADEKYDLTGQTYYFGIGASREAPTTMGVTQATSMGGSSTDYIYSVVETSDGGYIAGGYFENSSIQVGDYTLTNNGETDGMIIKYDAEGEVEWARSVGGSSSDYISSVASTSDGGYIAGGFFGSESIQVGDYTLTKNGGYYDGMIIKYSSSGEVEWATSIGGSSRDYIRSVASTSDGGYIVGGNFESSSIQVGDYTLIQDGGYLGYSDGMIIKYSSSREVEWARSVGGSGNEQITSIASTSDGGYIVGGYFKSSSIQVGDYTLRNNSSSTKYSDGMTIKYDANGEVEWATSIGGDRDDEITSVAATSDGNYIVGGYFEGNSIQVGDYTLRNNSSSTSYSDGMTIKYDANGEVEWAESVGGIYDEQINSVAETSDGGYIVGGYFESNSIQVGDYTLRRNNSLDGMIIKYGAEGTVELARSVGGDSDDVITSVAQTSDGSYIAGGYFESYRIQLGDYTLRNNSRDYDGMIIKFEKVELSNTVVTRAEEIGGSSTDYIYSVVETSDGGYIAGGYFKSSIQVGDYTLSNNGSADGMIIKYNREGEVEWARNVGGKSTDVITSVAVASDGGYIVGGYFASSSIQVGEYTLTTGNGWEEGMTIKYDANGEVEWATSIGGDRDDEITSVAVTEDGGYIVGGNFESSSIQVGDYTLIKNDTVTYFTDGMIIKYSREGEVEWATSIGGSSSDYIRSVASTSDGGDIIVGGYFESSSIQVGEYTLTNGNGWKEGMTIKYDANGEVEWATSIGGSADDRIESVAATSDGGYIAGGYFENSSIQVGDYTLSNNGYRAGMIIKYNREGAVEWARSVGGSGNEQITSIASTSDGGYIVGGYFESSSMQVGDYTLWNNSSSTSYSDGMTIKYDANGELEWATSIGGSSSDYIRSVASTSDGRAIAGGDFKSSSIQVGEYTLTNNSTNYSDGMILEIVNQAGVPEIQELTVENSRKEFKITTDVKEIDNVKGGAISGEDSKPYEIVKYGDSSTKEIVVTPDKNYEIIGITVNGEEWKFEENEDGTYIMPQFTNMTEDKRIEVTFALKDNKLTINKVDSKTKEPLAGAKFKLDQIEERTEPENVIGEIVANGETYYELNIENEITEEVVGELTNNGTYYFVKNADGTLTPTNSETYQIANGGTAGIRNSTANSYVKIDLSGLEGNYLAVVNANVSSESADYGYATISQTTTAPLYNTNTTSQTRFMYISGTSSNVTTPTDYTSKVLEGGQTYYLHLGYRKDSSLDKEDDQVVINSIKVYGTKDVTYNFIDNRKGGYESNNQGKDSTTANSYIPIDLTELTGKYNLTVNAEVSSQSSDYGFATVTSSTDRVEYDINTSSEVRFVYISGKKKAQDYTTVLQGGQMYYLHLGYYKNSSTSDGVDKFTVNDIKVSLNDSELYHTEVTTNSQGQGIVQIPFGKYKITEIKAPEGYEVNEEPIEIEFRADGDNHEITIENQESAKVIVHHYLKNNDGEYTTEKVAEDELLEGKIGEEYTTLPHLDLEKYLLEEDEEGNYVIPKNATGTYESGTIEITYYYEEKGIPLTVHHYIGGTETPVPLKDGGVAEDVLDNGKEGEEYTTTAISNDILSDSYELVEIPENSKGTYEGEEVVVTYYYKTVERPLTIVKTGENGEPLEGVKFGIQSKEEKLKVEPNGEYYFVEQNGKYISNNQNKHSTTANSYIKIDLTDEEDATITINAEISSESSDYGYATITNSESAPSYSSSTGRIFRISGQVAAKDYKTTLEGGKIYYLHLGYYKDRSADSYNDTFTINSIEINGYNELNKKEYTTNQEGKITITLPAGEYEITEIETQEDYVLPENPTQTINITREKDSYELTIKNIKKRPLTIVKTGENGEPLEGVKFGIQSKEEKLKVEPNGEYYFVEQNGKYISNNQNKHSTTANSYIKIDLTDEEDATITINAEISSESSDYGYATITNSESAPSYSSSTGRIFRISGQVAAKDYKTTLEGGKIYYLHLGYHKDSSVNRYNDTFTINSIEIRKEYITNQEGKITTALPPGEYEITEIETQEDYVLPENPTQTINITREKDSYELTIKNTKKQGTVITHHYIEGTTTKVPSNVDGEVVEDVIQTGKVGEMYITKQADNISKQYEFVKVEGNASGEYAEGTIEIIYYYKPKQSNLKIIKTDEEGNRLQGAEFEIKNKGTNSIVKGTTDENGEINQIITMEDYVITETKAPEGYRMDKKEYDIQIDQEQQNLIVTNRKINYYDFEITKVDSETGNLLSGAEFELTYTDQYGRKSKEKYNTDDSGRILLENLEDEIVYTLKETNAPAGYVEDAEEKQFVIHYIDEKFVVEVLQGSFKNLIVENNTIQVKVENKPSFKLIKQGTKGERVAGAKFTITDEEGNDVVDGSNNLVGELEEIDGENVRVITTDENGVIIENLLPGKYVVTEVQAPEGYEMSEKEEDRSQVIEIEVLKGVNISKETVINWEKPLEDIASIVKDKVTIINYTAYNNGIMLYGQVQANLTIPQEHTVEGRDINIEKGEGTGDGLIIYIDNSGKVEKVKHIKSEKDTLNALYFGAENKNKESIAIGAYINYVKIPGSQTSTGNEMVLTSKDVGIYLIKYNSNDKVEELKDVTYMMNIINDIETFKAISDKYIIEAYPSSDTFTVPEGETVEGQEITLTGIEDNKIMLVLNSQGKVISAKIEKEQTSLDDNLDYIIGKYSISTGDIVLGFSQTQETVRIPGNETVDGEDIVLEKDKDSILIGVMAKYNDIGKIEWAKKITNGYNLYPYEVSEGYITLGIYASQLIIPKEETESGESISLTGEETQYMLMKYNTMGQVVWAVNMSAEDIENLEGTPIITEIEDGFVLFDGINSTIYSEHNLSAIPTKQYEITIVNKTIETANIPVSKVWEDENNKLGQRPTRVVFKLTGSDGSEYTKELAKPGTEGSTTTQDSSNPNKWNDIFENLPRFDTNGNKITYTLTSEEEKTEGDLKYYDSVITDKTVTNTNKYGKVTVHHYIMNTDGTVTTTRVLDTNGAEIPDVVIEGKEGTPYTTEEAKNINEKYELVEEKLPENSTGTIEKYNEEKPQEVIYYYRLKPAKVIINYLEKDEDADNSNNQVLTAQEQIEGHVDDAYNTNTDHRKETITYNGRTYTLVEDSGNTEGTMTVKDTDVTYYYLQNTKATVRYVERDPETHKIVKDLEEPYTQEGLVGDEFVTNAKAFIGYELVESPEETTIKMTKEEQTLIYYYEPVYTGLVENHIDDKTGKILYTEVHDIQVGEEYNIPSKEFEGYDLVESKLPENAEGIMGEELVTVNYYYIKKAVLEVNYIDKLTGEPLTEQIVDETKHEGDSYTTEEKTFENYDLVATPENATGTMIVETDEQGNITNNRTVVTYYYSKKSAGVEEHHIDIRTGEELEEPILHEGHVGDEYNIPSKEFLSYQVVTEDEEGNNMLPENAVGTMTEEKIVVNYYYNQPAKVIVHYVEKATGKEIEETNPETGEVQKALVIIEGFNQDEYETTAKEFEYYTLIERPEEEQGKMKVEITKDEEGNDVVNNTIELYYYYEAKPFNIGVEKEITGIIVNGERRAPENGKLEKVEIYRKSTENTSVQVEYKIKVINSGEVKGNATIEENIPEGMSLANDDGTWEEQEGKLVKVIPEIGAGETKEYTVLLNWEQTGENMGEKANEVKLVETGNVPGFVDNNDKDNTSNANIIISVETGEFPLGLLIALVALVGLETVTLRYAVVLTKRQKRK